ncbi:M14 family zinc carboxypeptidase [Planctomicrobium sp. SH527]|uniref:M14 family zinc carboxypeptidase n=1 Tax=Planctomicrobium sp. SH527 TaxID=3448123 RepID=UPI003F5C80CE
MKHRVTTVCLLLLAFLIAQRTTCAQPSQPTTFGSSATNPQSIWASSQKSAGQRGIEVARFGTGDQYVLIVGSMSGNDPASINLLDATSQLAKTFPPPEPVTLLFVRTPNPDGMFEHVHTNARGVELDRNFPTRNFTTAPNRLTGPHPASEPETQYLVRILQEFKPVRVIHVQSGNASKPLFLLNSIWHSRTGMAMLPKDIAQDGYHSAYRAGSLEEFASTEMRTSVGTVVLSSGQRQVQPAELLRLAVGQIAKEQSPANGSQITAKPETPAANPQMESTPTAPGSTSAVLPTTTIPTNSSPEKPPLIPTSNRTSEVELLPPPPEFLATSISKQKTNSTDDGRFIELPPPPRSAK